MVCHASNASQISWKQVSVLAVTLCLISVHTVTNVAADDNQQEESTTLTSTDSSNAKPDESSNANSKEHKISALELYRQLFKQKRAAHHEAIMHILSLPDYEKQYKMLTLVFDKLFNVMTESKVQLMELGHSPGDAFPESEAEQNAFSRIAENTAFFGDILLRLPDMTHDLLMRNKEWELAIKWCVGFCNSSQVFQGKDNVLLDLVAQELGIIDMDPNYVNPYRESTKQTKLEDEMDNVPTKTKPVKKKKKEKKKGPRLSGVRHGEL